MTRLVALLPYLVSLGISLTAAVLVWRRPSIPGARAYFPVLAFEALWTGGYVCELLATTLAGKMFWDDLQLVGMLGAGVAMAHFARAYTGRPFARPWLTWSVGLGLPLSAVAWFVLPPVHAVLRAQARLVALPPFDVLTYPFTRLDLTLFAASYAGMLYGIAVLARRYSSQQRMFRRQTATVLAGALIPLVGGTLTLLGVDFGGQRDTTPFTFGLGDIVIIYALLRLRLFDLMPVAREAVFTYIPDGVIVADAQHRIVDVNPAAEKLLQRNAAGLIGLSTDQLVPGQEAVIRSFWVPEDLHVEKTLEAEGRSVTVDITLTALRDGERIVGRMAILRDVTARRKIEEALRAASEELEHRVAERTGELTATLAALRAEGAERRAADAERSRLERDLMQAQKMETIGRLAGGVAHDFNNLLTAIMGNASLGLLEAPPDSPLVPYLDDIQQAAQSAAALTRQLLAFSRKEYIEPRVLELHGLIGNLHKLLRRLLGDDVELETLFAADHSTVRVDPSQMEQVLVNLAVNARDAMPAGGRLTVSTSELELGGRPGVAAGRYLVVEVSDTGQGMPPEVREHVFEPFFTTKPAGKGTGLGLSTVYGAMRQNGGFVECESTLGRGTTFRLGLPLVEAAVESVTEPPSTELPGGSQTVLVAEDRELVRELVRRLLSRLGYQVLACADGTEALRRAEEHGGAIDLLVTDIVMPGMSGRELAAELRRRRPGLPVLFISGNAENELTAEGTAELGDVRFLAKPFTSAGLARKVREALEG